MSITRQELDAWNKYEVGKPCPKHPRSLVKKGRYGNWCGNKNELGIWCDGGWPTEDFLTQYRKENSNDGSN